MPYIDLAALKAHLNKADNREDGELGGYLTAAESMVEGRIGHVAPVTVTEDRVGGAGDADWLAETPVLSVTSVVTLPGLLPLPAEDLAAGLLGWSVTPGGLLRYGQSFAGGVRVTYVVGRNPVPAHIRLATLELAAHLWKSTQNARSPRNSTPDVPRDAPFGFAMPNRVQEMLEPEFRSRVVLA